jgi:nucleoside-diphosphate-sugar epimerase/putative sterol carrier protein
MKLTSLGPPMGSYDAKRERCVAVTGSAGSLGEAVLDQLSTDPDVAKVVAIDVAPPRRHAGNPKMKHVQADVRDASIGDVLREAHAVLHLAFVVERTGGKPHDEVESINVGGSQNVFRLALEAGLDQVVYASSIAAYGMTHPEGEPPITEDAPCVGSDDFYYSRHKGMVERWLDQFEPTAPSMRIARLRPTVFLSERSSARSARFLRSPLHARLGRPYLLQVTHEDDVAAAFVLALKKKARGAFNVAAEGAVDLNNLGSELGRLSVPVPREAVRWVASHAGLGIDGAWFREAERGGSFIVSAKKIRSELRWTPRYESSGDVLRAIGRRPNVKAGRALRFYWGPLVLLTRTLGGVPMTPETAAQARGFEGEINMVFTGKEPGAYRIRIGRSSFGVLEGSSPDARATVTMKTQVFMDILSGKTTAQTVMLSGRVRIRGEGEMLLIAMGATDVLARAARMGGAPAALAKRYARFLVGSA